MGYIDIHSHILWGVDDGCPDVESSIELVGGLNSIGFDTIAATSHIWPRVFSGAAEVRARFTEFEREIAERNIPVRLVLSGEHYLDGDFWEILEKGEAIPYEGTKYILVEFPLGKLPYNPHEIIFRLQQKGYKPVIAHAERYEFVQERPESLEPLVYSGAIIQGDIRGLIGKFTREEKKAMKALFELEYYHILATDSHGVGDLEDIIICLERLKNLFGEREIEKLLSENPRKIIEGKPF
ncbi:MAG: tyrosine-protein phosphatase [Myxococcota bacterium]